MSHQLQRSLGQRVSQTVSSVVTEYLLDTQPGLWKVIAADDGSNVNRFVHGPTGIDAQRDSSGNWDWMLKDGLGSVREVVDDNLNSLYTAQYAPYGEVWDTTGTEQTIFGYTGEPTDLNDLVHLRARYYDPGLAAFNSLDPVETANRYAYVSGDPVNMADPTGNSPACSLGGSGGFNTAQYLASAIPPHPLNAILVDGISGSGNPVSINTPSSECPQGQTCTANGLCIEEWALRLFALGIRRESSSSQFWVPMAYAILNRVFDESRFPSCAGETNASERVLCAMANASNGFDEAIRNDAPTPQRACDLFDYWDENILPGDDLEQVVLPVIRGAIRDYQPDNDDEGLTYFWHGAGAGYAARQVQIMRCFERIYRGEVPGQLDAPTQEAFRLAENSGLRLSTGIVEAVDPSVLVTSVMVMNNIVTAEATWQGTDAELVACSGE